MRPLLFSAAVIIAAMPALGQVHTGDIILSVSDNRVVTSAAVTGSPVQPERVFSDRFGKLGPSLPNRTPDPGYNAAPGQFPPGQTVGVRIRKAARLWTPSAAVPGEGNFCTIPDEQVEVRKNSLVIATPTVDPSSGLGPTIELGFSDPSDGLLHEHAVYWLTTPFDDGIYAVELEAWVGSPVAAPGAVEPSLPYWIVFNQNRPTMEHADAIAWLRANISGTGDPFCPVPVCPCDWNQSGTLTVQDIFDFLSSYFTAAADFNADGSTTVQDIFDFLACYFSGC